MSQNEYIKSNIFENLLYSQPQHLIFAYSPQAKHLRLLQLQKSYGERESSVENDFYRQQFNSHSHYGQQNSLKFIPKRCFMLDSQLSVIQKQVEGRPISYRKRFRKLFYQQLRQRVFTWYTTNESIIRQNQLVRQYHYYEQISNFCFGRKHFVRALNSVQLASDHISRNHCELVVQKGRGKQDVDRYFGLLIGVGKYSKANRLSGGNKLRLVPRQLWQKIYSYLFLTREKYFLVDNGSRNGTFFIECTQSINGYINSNSRQNSAQNVTNISHRLKIKQGFSYQFQGEEYVMKVWRMTEDRGNSQAKLHNITAITATQSILPHSLEDKVHQSFIHNTQTISYIQEFQEKINWYSNFEKVTKQYLIDQHLLERQLWKDKLVYKQMIKNNSNQNQQNYSNLQNQYISKSEFIKMVCEEYLLLQQIVGVQKNNKQSHINNYTQLNNRGQSQQQGRNYRGKIWQQQQYRIVSQMFITQQKLNTIVITLDFSDDFKRLYCIISESQRDKRFHLGFQMMINTARFQFEQHNRCNGYIHFNGSTWSVVALRDQQRLDRVKHLGIGTNSFREQFSDSSNPQGQSQPDTDHCPSLIPTTKQSSIIPNKQLREFDLSGRLLNKIWTKIPAMSQQEMDFRKCSNYIIRLAHSFYFELKFINFNEQNLQ